MAPVQDDIQICEVFHIFKEGSKGRKEEREGKREREEGRRVGWLVLF